MHGATFFRLGFASGEPLGAKTSMKKADGSAFGLAVQEPRSLRSRGCWCCIDPLYLAQLDYPIPRLIPLFDRLR